MLSLDGFHFSTIRGTSRVTASFRPSPLACRRRRSRVSCSKHSPSRDERSEQSAARRSASSSFPARCQLLHAAVIHSFFSLCQETFCDVEKRKIQALPGFGHVLPAAMAVTKRQRSKALTVKRMFRPQERDGSCCISKSRLRKISTRHMAMPITSTPRSLERCGDERGNKY